MRTTKRRYEHFQFYNSDGIEEHLAKQAAGGWQLTKITPFTWKYKKTEPQALRYTVCYFSEASEFNPKPTENQEVFHEYCKEAGWDFVAQWAQMQIFCSANCDATPIETDERVKLAVIHGAMKKNFLPGSFAMIAISLLQIFMQLYTLADDPIGLLSNSTALSTALAWNILAICFVLQAAGYFAWYLGSKKSVEQGGDCLKNGKLGGRISAWVLALSLLSLTVVFLNLAGRMSGILLLALVQVAAVFLLASWIKNALKRARASHGANLAITISACVLLSFVFTGAMAFVIFRGVRSGVWEDKPHEQYSVTYADGRTQTWPLYDDPIPLRLEDLQDVGDARYSCEWTENSSFLLSKGTARQLSHDAGRPRPRLEYEIVDVKQPFLFELCLGDYLKLRDKEEELPEEYRTLYRQTDDVAWQADAVYQKHLGNEPLDTYLICWGTRIVQIEFPQAPTAAQITSAVQKLRP